MRAIETRFQGHFYRSRLEARYAVCFERCRLAYEYEVEGFKLPCGWYLPDFYLPGLGFWFEVKGQTEPLDMDKCRCLADETRQRAFLARGGLSREAMLISFFPGRDGIYLEPLLSFLVEQGVPTELAEEAIEIAQAARFEFGETPD